MHKLKKLQPNWTTDHQPVALLNIRPEGSINSMRITESVLDTLANILVPMHEVKESHKYINFPLPSSHKIQQRVAISTAS